MSQSPRAMVVGPMKGGTTWIHDYLQARYDVCLPKGVKETFFFGEHFDKGINWYQKHFLHFDPKHHLTIVEVAPSYFHQTESPMRINNLLGNIPLLFTLRDPVRRAWSHYLHLLRYGYTKAPLCEAIKQFPEILEASRYRTCLKRWLDVFPSEYINILWQDLLIESPENYARAVCNALQLPYHPTSIHLQKKSNQSTVPPSYLLAALGSKISRFIRSKRLYGIINFAKLIGLKKVFFGNPGSRRVPALEDEDANWLAKQLEGEFPEDIMHFLGNPGVLETGQQSFKQCLDDP